MNEIESRVVENKKRREAAKNPPPEIQKTQVKASKWVWTLGAFAIDLVTGYAIWKIAAWWYGALWVLAGAGGLIYSQWLKERVGNNAVQRKISGGGVVVSWIAILLMAVIAGVVYVLGKTDQAWVAVVIVVSVVSMFGYHVLQSYRYHSLDDDYIAANEEAREVEDHARALREIDRAALEVERAKEQESKLAGYRREHGGAFDAAYSGDRRSPVVQSRTNVPSENRNSSVKNENLGENRQDNRPPTNYALPQLAEKSSKSIADLKAMEDGFARFNEWKEFVRSYYPDATGGNIGKMLNELKNPTQAVAASKNGRR